MARSLRSLLNEANPNKLPTAAQQLRLGNALGLVPRFIRAATVAHIIVLPEAAKAVRVLDCWVTAGTVNGQFSPSYDPDGVPATTTCTVNPAGNLAFLAADAVTEAEVVYLAREGTVFEDVVAVVSNSGAFLQSRKGVQLLEVEALVGTTVGVKALTAVRGATPGAGIAALNLLGTAVVFAAADAVTRARVKYIATPGVGFGPARSLAVELEAVDKEM